jgi:hypothetical protein
LRALADGVQKVLSFTDKNEGGFDQESEFSIFEQFFHHDYGFWIDGPKTPAHLIDAIRLFGARNTLDELELKVPDRKKWSQNGAASLVPTATKTGLLDRLIAKVPLESLSLRGAIAHHDEDALAFLLMQGGKLTRQDVDALFTFANFQAAIRFLTPDNGVLTIDQLDGDGPASGRGARLCH